MKKCTLPFSTCNFVSKCLLLYIGSQKELLEKKLEYFFHWQRTFLNIVVGRHNKRDYQARICSLCDKQAIEDEYHFVIQCDSPVYKNLREFYLTFLREFYLPYVDTDRSTEQLFYSLFNGKRDRFLI